MSNFIVMVPSETGGASLGSPAFATVEDALQGARVLLGNGAASAWIVDADGGIFLPAEQVLSRLNATSEYGGEPMEASRTESHNFQPILPS